MSKKDPTPKAEASARDRLVAAAADMLSRRGLNATSIRELAKHAKAPLGSTYHYFPDGKRQVVVEAVEFAGKHIEAKLTKALVNGGAIAGVRAFLAYWRAVIESTDFKAGCPVLAVSLEEPQDEDGRAALQAAAQVFEAWESDLAEALQQEGLSKGRASDLATLVVAAFEGTVALCRAKMSTDPLLKVSHQLEKLIESELGAN
jgi:AcrR family transcriptional regulator